MKEPVETLIHENCLIKIFEENNYEFYSSDNGYTYSNIYINIDECEPSTIYGIQLFDDDQLIADCLIGAEGGSTGIYKKSILISQGSILICCANTVFRLSIPNLNLEWKTISDSASCIGIYSLDADYIVHGELDITRLDKDGNIVWSQSGRDIWTTEEGVDDFQVYDDYILATDWEYNICKFDYNGILLEDHKAEPIGIQKKTVERVNSWWKFWK